MNVSMEQALHCFPDHLAEAETLCREFAIPPWGADRVAILGMGGSAIGGDLARVIAEKNAAVPVQVIRDEGIPKFVDEKTLVIAVSYSGNTHETLSSLSTALGRTKKVAVLCTGGKLLEIARKRKLPFLQIPGGLMPRAALGYTFVPVLHILKRVLGWRSHDVNLDESITVLKSMREKLSKTGNEAKTLARSLRGKIPVIFAPTSSFDPAARRFKCQINENAKQPAFYEVFPEATHNGIVGYTKPLPLHKSLAAVFLRDSDESPLVQKRIDFTKKTLLKSGTQIHETHSQGKLFMTRLLSLCYFGDYVSFYLAKENAVDPTPIAVIDGLKKDLAAVS